MTDKASLQALTPLFPDTSPLTHDNSIRTWKILGWVGLLGLTLAVRLYQLAEPGLWQDEVWSINLARQPLNEMFELIRSQDLQPPLYYLLLRPVLALGIDNNFTLRGLAVLFDLLALWPLYLFARKMAGERAAWFAILFFSLSAIHLIFSQMVRMYTLLALLVLLSFYLFWRIMQTLRPTWPLLIGYVATTSAMLYTQNLAALYLVAQGLALLILFRRRTLLIRASLLWVSSLLLWSPLLVIFLQQAAGNTFFDKPSILLLLDSFVAYGGADKAHNGQPFALLALAQPYFVLGLGLAVWLGLSNLRERRAERTYLLLFWLVPLSLCWLISQIKPIYADRAFLASSFPFFIILGAAFNRFDAARPRVFKCFWGPLVGGGLALLLSVAALVGLNTGGYARDDLRGLGRDAAVQLAGPNQARFLLQFSGNSPIIFNHYTPPGSPANLADYNQATEKLLEAAGAGRICAITSTSTELLAVPRAAYQRFEGWLAARSRQQSLFRQNYPDQSLRLQCWDYQT